MAMVCLLVHLRTISQPSTYIKSNGRTTLHVKFIRMCKHVVVFNQRALLQILFVRTEEITKTSVTIFSR
jgi:hypothetical protein